MIGHSNRVRADHLAETVQDIATLAREPGIRTHVVGRLLGHMTAAEVALALQEHGDVPSVIAEVETLCPGIVAEGLSLNAKESQ